MQTLARWLSVAAVLCSFVAQAGNVFRVTPYVQHPATDAMTLKFISDGDVMATVSWWKKGDPSTIQSDAAVSPVLANDLQYYGDSHAKQYLPEMTPYMYTKRIIGLAADTEYEYSVTLAGGPTYSKSFRTAPSAFRPVRFVCYADSETEPASNGSAVTWDNFAQDADTNPSATSRKYLVDQTVGYASNICTMVSRKPDFFVVAGDLVQTGSCQTHWDEFWRHNAGALNDPAGSIPIMAALGNHEYSSYSAQYGEQGAKKFLSYFEFEPNTANVSADQKQRFHRLDYGPIAVIFIDPNNGPDDDPKLGLACRDTNYFLHQSTNRAPDFNPASDQYKWLEEQLADAQTNKLFTFLVCHQCPFSAGYHGRIPYEMGRGVEEEFLSGAPTRCLTNLVFKYGVDAWICGHDEMYEHSQVTGEETLPDGTKRATTLNVYDIGIGGDGLRGCRITTSPNPNEVFRAHVDAPEVYDNGNWQTGTLVSGGKHYGHLEVNVATNAAGQWTATLTPVYNFVSKNASTGALTFERRTYPDEIVVTNLTHSPEPPAPIGYVWTGAGKNDKASNAANWLLNDEVPATAPQAGDDVVFNATGDGKPCTWDLDVALASWTQDGYTSTVTIQTKFGDSGFTCLNVTGNINLQSGTWTHTANGSTEIYRLNVTCGGNFTVGANAEINADAKGYENAGPGRSNNHSGGSYGGYCNNFNSVTSYGRCYGSIASPINIGSSGPAAARQGGGSIRLAVTGTLTVDGHVYARGNRAVNSFYSGSGGSVWLTASNLVGAATGRIAADGGLNNSNYFAAGGRVSLCQTGDAADFAAYLGKVTADGARTAVAEETGYAGSPGTIYYELASDGRGKGALVIDAKTASYKRSDFFIAEQDAGFSPKSITLRNGATLNVFGDGTAGNQTFVFDGKLVMDGTATFGVDKGAVLDIRGMTTEMSASGTHTFTFGKDVKVLSDKKMTLDAVTMKFNGTGLDWSLDTLVCTNGGGIVVSADNTLDVGLLHLAKGASVTSDRAFVLTGDVVMEDGATVTHTANSRDTTYSIDWTVRGDMTVKAGAKFTAKGKGYPQGTGPGTSTALYDGASHGGWCWNAYSNRAGLQACYGSLTQPTALGSGNSSFDARGGGAVRLTVAGDFVNDGLVDADGADGANAWFNASGGSVWITAATISGTGKIESNAHGYNNTSAASHGLCSGGRVAVWLTKAGADFADYTGVVSAFSAYNGSKAAGPGTVYLKTGDEAANGGTLVISNGMSFASEPTAISANVTDLSVGKLVVAPNTTLKLLDGKVLSVSGDVVNRGTISATADSGLALTGTGTSTIDGDLTLGVFDCLVPGKTIAFAAGSTLSIVADGRFKIDGAQGNPVTLKSTVDGSAWNLVVDPLAAAAVSDGNVSDCDASGGQKIAAVNSTLTRTANWSNSIVVYGQLLTWTGASGGSGWLTAANWDAERAPLATDRIRIPATAVQPVLGADAASIDLTVEEGATLDLAGFDYTVTENLAATGTVKSAGSPTVTVNGNCDLTGATFAADDLTLVIAGTGAKVQTLKGGNAMVARVLLRPSAAGLAVTEGFTAFYLTAEASAARTITFTPGSTLTSRVVLDFAASGSLLSLVSATPNEPWNLVIGGTAKATGVTVSDSVVTGTILCATDSTDEGGNTNWDFGALVPFHWTATATSPAATDAAYVDSTLTAATGDLTVRTLVLKSGAAFTLPKNSTLTVTESLVVEDGATATLNGKVSVGGSFQIRPGATVTHSQSPSTSTVYTMDVTVGGDFVLDAGGTINLNGVGYAKSTGPGGSSYSGSHAGRSESHQSAMDNLTYGSALWPVKPGSGGSGTAGGGAVQLKVSGVAHVNGTVTANGAPSGTYYPGSGGSIAIRAAALVGTGTMTANGGDVGIDYTGGGGRIAVILTGAGEKVARFAGTMQAYSGKMSGWTLQNPRGSAGTIYVEDASDGAGRGRVIVDNSAIGVSRSDGELTGRPRTDYPVMNDKSVAKNESKNVTWILRNTVNLNITKDAKVGDLWLEGSKPKVYLNGHTLRINAHRHALGTSDAQIVPGGTAENPGKIIWRQGLSVVVR